MAKFGNPNKVVTEPDRGQPDVMRLVDPRAEGRQPKDFQALCVCGEVGDGTTGRTPVPRNGDGRQLSGSAAVSRMRWIPATTSGSERSVPEPCPAAASFLSASFGMNWREAGLKQISYQASEVT